MVKTVGYAATFLNRTLKPKRFERQDPGPADVELELLYCGICHSDVHQVNNDWSNTVWPCVPGHEIVGKVSRVGNQVRKFKVGDLAAVGCMVDSCGECYSCKGGNEQYCESDTAWLATYNGPMNPTLQNTYGGYSSRLVVKERFLLAVPAGIPTEAVGPILCAGVTTYSPLKRWGVKPGMKVGIIGFGGLGHMATQLARAMGGEVTVITTSLGKREAALGLGATRVVVSTDKQQMKDAAKSLDFILNTIPEKHEIDPYLDLLHRDGAMTIVGVLVKQPGYNPQQLIMHRRTVSGSLIGSIAETREVLEFCAEKRVFPKVKVIPAEGINDAYKTIEKKEASFRFVIDLSTLPKEDIDSLDELKPVTHLLKRDKVVVLPQPEVHAGADRENFEPTWNEGQSTFPPVQKTGS